jgi:hypothetical protein
MFTNASSPKWAGRVRRAILSIAANQIVKIHPIAKRNPLSRLPWRHHISDIGCMRRSVPYGCHTYGIVSGLKSGIRTLLAGRLGRQEFYQAEIAPRAFYQQPWLWGEDKQVVLYTTLQFHHHIRKKPILPTGLTLVLVNDFYCLAASITPSDCWNWQSSFPTFHTRLTWLYDCQTCVKIGGSVDQNLLYQSEVWSVTGSRVFSSYST